MSQDCWQLICWTISWWWARSFKQLGFGECFVDYLGPLRHVEVLVGFASGRLFLSAGHVLLHFCNFVAGAF